MTRYLLPIVAFLAGLAVVGWIGIGYAGSNALALAVTLLIGAFYLTGAFELHRYRRATDSLAQAVADLSEAPATLGLWLDRIHPSLRNAVRLRIEGERVALPGPALTPHLVGLLVLLGMLGTFLGMVATLRGTGLALESVTDLQAIRASLAAPVKGLGFAFGTSVAGVATSAMLGLLSALCRREAIDAAQRLDARIATTLRIHSRTHQREEAFKLLQRQTEAMPALVDRLQAMMTAMEQQSLALAERLAASQDAFHGKTEAIYTRLASSVGESLKDSVADGARAAGAAIQPAVDATMAGLARETAVWRETVAQAVQQQLDQLSNRFESTTATVAQTWSEALAQHQRTSDALARELGTSLAGFTASLEQRSAGLVDNVAARLDAAASHTAQAFDNALSRQERTSEKLADDNQRALATAVAAFERHAASLVQAVTGSHADLQTDLASRDEQRLAVWTDTLGALGATLREQWTEASTRAASRQQETCDALAQTARDISAQTQAHASSTIAEIDRLVQAAAQAPQAALALQTELAARDEQRLAAWTESLGAMATALRTEWAQASAQTADRQQQICETLARIGRELSAQTREHASDTIAEVARLVQSAAEAPRAAAEVIAELRQKLTEGMARDNAMLEERSRMLETLGTLLDAVNHASTEQRTAVDSLVTTTADLLDRVGTRFTDQVQSEAGKLTGIAAQITGSAVEVASLGEAFGAAVQLFSESNHKLTDHLQRIEAALDKSMARSDEQLAYYVAQAREVVDLSMLSQKQILEDLRHLSGQPPTRAEAA
jgi:hypothetical protein